MLKAKRCLHQLTGNDEDNIAGKINWLRAKPSSIDKHTKKMKLYREKEFKECKPVEFSIKRVKM